MEKLLNKNLISGLLAMLIIWVGILAVNEFKESRFIGAGITAQNTISVQGKGEVLATPDLALVNVTVANEARTIKAAQDENTRRANQVLAFLKEQGIDEKDIKTVGYNVNPRYEFRKEAGIFPSPSGRRVLVGYEVTSSLLIKIRDFDKIGLILDGAVSAGANRVGSLRFSIEDDEALEREARQKAIGEAQAKAQELAQDLGVSLVRLVRFNESGRPYPVLFAEQAVKAGVGGGAETPVIEPGQNEITVIVNLTYEIR
jgi:hypothetical protein